MHRSITRSKLHAYDQLVPLCQLLQQIDNN